MPGMVPEDVYELTSAADPRVSPDGKTVAFVVGRIDREANEYKSNVWLVPADGSAPPRQVTFGTRRDGDPRWSPDGSRLAFTSKRDGNDHNQLYVMPVGEAGEPRRLTEVKEDVQQPAWSPDGTRIVFASRVPHPDNEETDDKKRKPRRITKLQYKMDNEGWTYDRPHHIFVVLADGSAEPKQITSGDFDDTRPAWSPDGSRIAFTSARHEDWDIDTSNDLYVVGVEGGEPERLTSTDGGVDLASWSPDGTRIAYQYTPGTYDDPRHTQIAVLDVATRKRTVLTEHLDRNCHPYPDLREPIWDGTDLLFAFEEHGNTPLHRGPADGSSPSTEVMAGEFVLTGLDSAGGTLAYSKTTPTALSELYVGDRKLTEVGKAFGEGRELVEPERFTAVSADGTEVECWIMRPAGFEEGAKVPLLLNVHGGPFTQYGNKLFDEFQVYTGAGYAVVYCNPRGSSGYTEAWGRAIRGPVAEGPGWGTVDYEDVMACVDEALKRFDFVDPDRMAVMGGSYGGYMTSWVVGHTDRFVCGISERSVNDVRSEGGASDIGIWWKAVTGAHYWEEPEAMMRISPATYSKDIRTPLLILHSEKDFRCPIGQGEDLFTRLRAMKREVEMVRFPDEGHELSRSGSPIHRVQRFEVILEYLGRYLQKD
jgi:dipeptidyl aminopeptidase/acylaminoacyl peptidase